MKWHDDIYGELKWEIFDIVRKGLICRHLDQVSVKILTDGIDKFIHDIVPCDEDL